MNIKISTYTIIKNEVDYVGYCIMSVLPYVDEMVFSDGNSTDGTLELIKHIKKKYDKKKKIKLFENRDCKNLRNAYTKLFNWTVSKCTGTHVIFLHPDMICVNPQVIRKELDSPEIRFSTKMVSFAGDTKHVLSEGRDDRWASVYRVKHGLHYHGWYGEKKEDMYFKDITGDEHEPYHSIAFLPYRIKETNIMLYHYCDTKPYGRRFGRMVRIITNVLATVKDKILIEELAKNHPRVTLVSGSYAGRDFVISKTSLRQPRIFNQYKKEFERFKCVKE